MMQCSYHSAAVQREAGSRLQSGRACLSQVVWCVWRPCVAADGARQLCYHATRCYRCYWHRLSVQHCVAAVAAEWSHLAVVVSTTPVTRVTTHSSIHRKRRVYWYIYLITSQVITSQSTLATSARAHPIQDRRTDWRTRFCTTQRHSTLDHSTE